MSMVKTIKLDENKLRTKELSIRDIKNAEKIIVYSSNVKNGMVDSKDSLSGTFKIYKYNPVNDRCEVEKISNYANGETSYDKELMTKDESKMLINFAIEERNTRNSLYPNGIKVYYYPKSLQTNKGYKTAVYGKKPQRDSITQLENSVRKMF